MFISKLLGLEVYLKPGIQHPLRLVFRGGQNPNDFQVVIIDFEDTKVISPFLEVLFKTIWPINFKLCTTHLRHGGENHNDCQAAIIDFKVDVVKKVTCQKVIDQFLDILSQTVWLINVKPGTHHFFLISCSKILLVFANDGHLRQI